MIKSLSNHPSGAVQPEPWMEQRLATLDRMSARDRIAAIEEDLRDYPKHCTDPLVFHRKALGRMLDQARLEAGVVTLDGPARENSYLHVDWSKSQVVFRPRIRE